LLTIVLPGQDSICGKKISHCSENYLTTVAMKIFLNWPTFGKVIKKYRRTLFTQNMSLPFTGIQWNISTHSHQTQPTG